jgi:hypothetical protein
LNHGIKTFYQGFLTLFHRLQIARFLSEVWLLFRISDFGQGQVAVAAGAASLLIFSEA